MNYGRALTGCAGQIMRAEGYGWAEQRIRMRNTTISFFEQNGWWSRWLTRRPSENLSPNRQSRQEWFSSVCDLGVFARD